MGKIQPMKKKQPRKGFLFLTLWQTSKNCQNSPIHRQALEATIVDHLGVTFGGVERERTGVYILQFRNANTQLKTQCLHFREEARSASC